MKLDDLSLPRRELIGALFALAEAISGSEHLITPQTEMLIRSAILANDPAPWLSRVRAEKDRFAPDCRVCTHPCGRTAEFDLQTLRGADPFIRETKLRLVERAEDLARSSAHLSVLTDILRVIGEDYPPEALRIAAARFD